MNNKGADQSAPIIIYWTLMISPISPGWCNIIKNWIVYVDRDYK